MSDKQRPMTGRTVLYWLFGFFGVMFAANAAFIYYAAVSWPGTVTDSAFTDSQTFDATRAEALALEGRDWVMEAEVFPAGEGLNVIVRLRDANGAPVAGKALGGFIGRPASDRQDHQLVFTEGELGQYSAPVSQLEAGEWMLNLRAENAEGHLAFATQRRLRLF